MQKGKAKCLAFRLFYHFFLVLSFLLFRSVTLCIFLSLRIHVRVRDAGMIDGLESLSQYKLGEGDVAEGDRTFLEEALCHLSVDEFVYQVADALFCVFIERAEAASTVSAIIRMVCSRVNGFCPGYWNSDLSTTSVGCSLQ